SEGISETEALAGVSLSLTQLNSSATRVSANQILQSCQNATRLSRDPQFAYKAGLEFHVSTYGMYRFSLFSCPNLRQTKAFGIRYQQLTAPTASVRFPKNGLSVPECVSHINSRFWRKLRQG